MTCYVLDTGALNRLCHPNAEQQAPVLACLRSILADHNNEIAIPAIAVYEYRRVLLRDLQRGYVSALSLVRLNELVGLHDYLPLSAEVERIAAQLWANVRKQGTGHQPTAPDRDLDFDVLISAHAVAMNGTVITNNKKHLSRYTSALHWEDLAS